MDRTVGCGKVVGGDMFSKLKQKKNTVISKHTIRQSFFHATNSVFSYIFAKITQRVYDHTPAPITTYMYYIVISVQYYITGTGFDLLHSYRILSTGH